VNFLKSKRRFLLITAAILLALFIIRPGANGLRKRIVNSVSMALGRRVEVQWVKLRVLPQPGFDLENFVVYDDPAFGAEPMLRADEVTAALRLRSLLRGRLEIGRLSLKEPSFNLVRDERGHWNIEALLDRAAHTPAVPTSHTRPERRPVFPYIEADNGRINFKIGQEKKAYALTDADFALWLESENQWGMRLAAKPMRTDFNLSDLGIVRAEGTWQRSGSLSDTPLKFTVDWERAQLGQFTKLISGKDKGWRGGVTLASTLAGTPAHLMVTARATIEDFRRYDIVSSDSLRLAASCTAQYSSTQREVSNIVCQAPLSQGILILAGSIQSPTGPRNYDLAVLAQDIPLQPLVSLARHAKRGLPDDLTGKGMLNGDISLRTVKDAGQARLEWSGTGEIESLRLSSRSTQSSWNSDALPFAFSSTAIPEKAAREIDTRASGSRLEIGPFAVALGGSSAVKVNGWTDATSYDFLVQGESQVQRLLSAAQTLGLQAPRLTADGTARLRFEVGGAWSDFAAPQISGIAQLHSIRGEFPGTGPFDIASANLLLAKGRAEIGNISASAAGARWTGAISIPQPCSGAACSVELKLNADTLYVDRLRNWLYPKPRPKPWYRVLSPNKPQGASTLKMINAGGTISAARVVFRGLIADNVSAQLEMKHGHVAVRNLRGGLLGGRHVGNWEADLQTTPPTYNGDGRLEQISLSDLAQAMHSDWITGSGSGSYRFIASGSNARQALKSASATLKFDVFNGLMPHLALASSGPPLRIRHFGGQLLLRDGGFRIEDSQLETATHVYQVSGTATMERKLNLKFVSSGAHMFNISGTLTEPRVSPGNTAETQAALKP
jgi:hypothetical protein